MELDLVSGLVNLAAAMLTLAAVAIGLFKKPVVIRERPYEAGIPKVNFWLEFIGA